MSQVGSGVFVQPLKAITVAGYYGMLRIGERTTGSHPIMADDVYVDKEKKKLQIILRSSKTHNRGSHPQRITITSSQDTRISYCPHHIILTYAQGRKKYRSCNDPFFIFRDGTPVKPTHYHRVLRRAIMDIGLELKYYNTHSLRSGRAVDLFKGGKLVSHIKKMGQWRFNAVYDYLKI